MQLSNYWKMIFGLSIEFFFNLNFIISFLSPFFGAGFENKINWVNPSTVKNGWVKFYRKTVIENELFNVNYWISLNFIFFQRSYPPSRALLLFGASQCGGLPFLGEWLSTRHIWTLCCRPWRGIRYSSTLRVPDIIHINNPLGYSWHLF